jgi:hypothetical protein
MSAAHASESHRALVEQVVADCRERHFVRVSAAIEGYPEPRAIRSVDTRKWHTPDVTALGEALVVFDVETAETLEDPSVSDRWRTLAGWASDRQAIFQLVVPRGCAPAARKRLDQEGIYGAVAAL